MARTIEIRPLSPSDDRSTFWCGDPAIDRFFEFYAGQNQFKLRLAVTYVAVAGARILGFATVVLGSIEKRESRRHGSVSGSCITLFPYSASHGRVSIGQLKAAVWATSSEDQSKTLPDLPPWAQEA